jgi:uncharacterized protein (TIGR03086 family)
VAVEAPTLDQLRAALEHAGGLVAAVQPEQWSGETPCEDWDVRALVSHVVAGNRLFAAALGRDEPAEVAAASVGEGEDLVAAFGESASKLLAAFAARGVLQRVVRVPFGAVPGEIALHLRLTEVLVHGWDLASATGQRADFDDSVAAQELEFSRTALGALPPERRPFGAPQHAPADAPDIERLVALLGRRIA